MTVPVGAAVVEVDVPAGTPMAGFAARTGPSVGVHDPLSVRALVLDGVALVTVDVCGLHERTIAQVQRAVADVVRGCVVLATHTHSGPCIAFGRLGPHAGEVHDDVVRAAVTAVHTAVDRARPCRVRYRETPGLGIATNRRHRDRRVNPPAQALVFVDAAGTIRAWLVLYPCHPVVLDATNRLVSGDYPAVVRERLEAAAPESVAVFLTGTAGDLNTGHRVEDSYAADASGKRTFAEADRIGWVLADAVLAAADRPLTADGVGVHTRAVALAFDRVDPAEADRQRAAWRGEIDAGVDPLRAALLTAWIEWADALLAGAYDHLGDAWPATVTALTIGDAALVTLPGEPFLRSAERIAAGAAGPVLVAGYANGCPGYVPPVEEYPHGGYEVVDAHRYYGMPGPFAPGSAERLEAAARAALAEAAGES